MGAEVEVSVAMLVSKVSVSDVIAQSKKFVKLHIIPH
jgi:hypothetical protein